MDLERGIPVDSAEERTLPFVLEVGERDRGLEERRLLLCDDGCRHFGR